MRSHANRLFGTVRAARFCGLLLFCVAAGTVGPTPATSAAAEPPAASSAASHEPGGATDSTTVAWRLFESEKGPLLLGRVDRQDILNEFPEWQEEYAGYLPDPGALDLIARVERPVTVTCVLGTWCHDSEREVPRFWKVLDLAETENIELVMYATGRQADAEAEANVLAPLGFTGSFREAFEVELVPTFVFSVGEEEMGRIVESPDESLEADAAAILADLIPTGAEPVFR